MASLFMWEKDSKKRKALEILFVFGSTTFFGQPLIKAVFPTAFNDSSLFNISYRVFLYSYAYYAICVDKDDTTGERVKIGSILKKIFVNPIIIATLVGFVLWSLQLIGDTKDTSNWWVVTVNNSTGAFWNISVSMPWLYQTLSTLGSLASPLVWIAIGATLAKVPLKQAALDKTVWIYSALKLILAPCLNILLLLLINTFFKVSFNTVAATTLMWATPPATVAVTYCINSNNNKEFASSCSLISTFLAVVCIPLYIIILTVLQSLAIFH